MATKTVKRVRKTKAKNVEEVSNPVVESPVYPVETEKKPMSCKKALGFSAAAILALLVLFWYKTNTWPIAAVANGRVITRFALDKNLFQQGGKTVLDNLITEQLVRSELDKEKITVSSQDVDKKLSDLKKQLPAGSDLKSLLEARGMTENDLRKQIELQLRIEKAVSNKTTVSTEEIDKFVKENESSLSGTTSAEKRINAEELLKTQKSQSDITAWVEKIRKDAKVWTPDNSWTATSAPVGQ